jgi:DNA repair protein RecO (recombination protein O)
MCKHDRQDAYPTVNPKFAEKSRVRRVALLPVKSMPTEQSFAIVLRLVEFSETSLVATLFTRDFGKIGALAKGARRPKSSFEAALDLLAVCRIVFIHKSSDALDLLTEARLERRFRAASRELSRLYAGYYVAELLHELTDTGDPHPELFDAADEALYGLDTGQDVAQGLLRFELTTLRVLGHMPSLTNCVGCGDLVRAAGRVAFGQLHGGVLCERCRPGKRQIVSVSGEVIRVLQQLAIADGATWRQVRVEAAHRAESRALMNRYFENLLGRRLRTRRYLDANL